MILAIVPELTDDVVVNSPPNVKVIDYNQFNSLAIHPFIATNVWESVDITLTKGIHAGYIKQVLTKGNIINITIPEGTNLDYELLLRLTEVYPASSSELRKAYMSKVNLKELLLREGVIFE